VQPGLAPMKVMPSSFSMSSLSTGCTSSGSSEVDPQETQSPSLVPPPGL
jgi:hypothetical protein